MHNQPPFKVNKLNGNQHAIGYSYSKERHERQLGDSPPMPVTSYTYHTRDLHLKGVQQMWFIKLCLGNMKYQSSTVN